MEKWTLSFAAAAAILAGIACSTSVSASTFEPKTGSAVPQFEAKDQDGKAWSLSSFTGKKAVLLYFYPKDDTPGCTKEACGLRDRMEDLKRLNVEVVGVSFDSHESHQRFREKYKLRFTLLADTDGKIADLFKVRMGERNMARRVSFLIAANGKIVHVTESPDADVHISEMTEAAKKLSRS